MDCAPDARVSAAAADVAAHGFVNVFVGGLRIFFEEHGGAHDLTGLAVAALRNIDFNPGTLEGMGKIGREAFDGRNVFAFDSGEWSDTRADGFAFEMDGAGAAKRHAASEFGSSETERIANDPEKRS